ncbi:N-acetylglutamate kinase [Salimicrobium halophilum]|uniref:acetylglutamate kinase n=2 Tax=Salimicrobium halophilum TaxID=86666 RepID=A0A1G8TMJ8_9BACI|nr:N-acetylglutamate kinase [Salimicrobium halophilum]
MLDELEKEFLQSVKELKEHYDFIVVHGAGPDISSKLKALNVNAPFIQGLRKTTKPAMEVVETVLSGTKNRELTGKFIEEGVHAVGLKGCDGMIRADYLDYDAYGYVGTSPEVETELLSHLLSGGFLPVVAPLGRTESGDIVNINADTAAAGIARALDAEKLIFVTDVPGVMKNKEVLTKLTSRDINQLIEEKTIDGGMIPKVRGAEEALSETLEEVMITSGKQPIIQNNAWQGTIIHKERKETMT